MSDREIDRVRALLAARPRPTDLTERRARLDAIGAVGIARAFAFGGARGRKLYDQQEEARKDMSVSEYRKKETATVTHFHEKLLLLRELMVTKEGTRLAKERHDFMEVFLHQLSKEID